MAILITPVVVVVVVLVVVVGPLWYCVGSQLWAFVFSGILSIALGGT